MNLLLRGSFTGLSLIALWQLITMVFNLPAYILPTPCEVAKIGYHSIPLILSALWPTLLETLLGLLLGTLLGCATAIMMAFIAPIATWLLPILIISQAIPTFAIAPLLVIWLGYGIASKIAVTIMMLFFPITSAFFEGLQKTESNWLDLAKTMNAKKWRVFWYIRIPAALPFLASGLRIATAIAPIGAVIGEWVGASRGLGFLMLNANARMQIDLMFAVLFTLIIFSLLFYFIVDRLLRWVVYW